MCLRSETLGEWSILSPEILPNKSPLTSQSLFSIKSIMGLTYVNVSIANPSNLKRARKKKLLADSGALYSIVPKEVLRAIGIRPYGSGTFTLADGSTIRRQVGNAFLQIDGRQALTPVIFGEKGDGSLLGEIALESLGFSIHPRTGKLRSAPLLLM